MLTAIQWECLWFSVRFSSQYFLRICFVSRCKTGVKWKPSFLALIQSWEFNIPHISTRLIFSKIHSHKGSRWSWWWVGWISSWIRLSRTYMAYLGMRRWGSKYVFQIRKVFLHFYYFFGEKHRDFLLITRDFFLYHFAVFLELSIWPNKASTACHTKKFHKLVVILAPEAKHWWRHAKLKFKKIYFALKLWDYTP